MPRVRTVPIPPPTEREADLIERALVWLLQEVEYGDAPTDEAASAAVRAFRVTEHPLIITRGDRLDRHETRRVRERAQKLVDKIRAARSLLDVQAHPLVAVPFGTPYDRAADSDGSQH